MPDGALAPAGFPAGLIAAQSIGERGTQLSMQSFHTGKRAFTISDVRRVLGHGDEDKYFEDLDGASRFVAELKGDEAYASLQDRHFHILWRVIKASPEHTLRSAIKRLGAMSRIAFQRQAREIAVAALSQESSPLAEPAARVLFGLFGARSNLI
jgi:DNA-directed RNA polymerase subunit beta-beta'